MPDYTSRPPDDILAIVARHVTRRAAGASAADQLRATYCVAHHVACCLDGGSLPWSQSVLSATPRPPGGTATVVGSPAPADVADAIFANAVLGQSTLAEDVHSGSVAHPGSMVVPVALALGETLGSTGAQVLSAVVAGYEVTCRLGTALRTPAFAARGFRPSGIFGPLGAAAAAAVLLGLDEKTTAAALGIAANCAAGLREWANSGSTDVYLQNGFAARNGYQAAVLASRGITGPAGALTGPAGMGVAFSGGQVDWAKAAESFCSGSVFDEIQFKRFPACSGVQTVLELTTRLHQEYKIDPQRVSRVVIYTHEHGKHNPGCDHAGPWSDVGQAQMSNQFGVALALTGAAMTVRDYQRFRDPGLGRLAALVKVIERPEFTELYPGRSAAAVEIQLDDGTVVAGDSGDATPLSDDEVMRNLAAIHDAAGETAVPSLSAVISALGQAWSVADLSRALRQK